MLNVRSPRNALVIATVVTVSSLIAAGCGSAPPESGAAVTVAPTTASTLRTITAAASGPSGQGGDTKVAGGWAAAPESSMQLAWVEYVIDGELPAMPDTAGAWLFEPGAAATLEQVARLASAFGITEQPVAVTNEWGGGWQVGPTDGSAPSLTVTNSATLDWYFSPAWATVSSGPVACAGVGTSPGAEATGGQTIDPAVAPPVVSVVDRPGEPPVDTIGTVGTIDDVVTDGSTQTVPDCAPPAPVDVPSEDEARSLATDLLGAAGLDPSATEFEVFADDWGASVTAYTMVGGFRSPFANSFGFGEQGAVTWASGTLAAPVAAGDYPLINAAAGIDRLNNQSKEWIRIEGGPRTGQVDPAGSATATATEAGTSPGTATPVPVDPPLGAPVEVPIGSEPGVEVATPNKIAVTGVRLDLTSIWDVDGTIWLLPAFTYTNVDGDVATVAAVTDEYLQTPDVPLPSPSTVPVETLPIETLPVETLPVETVPVEPVPVGTVQVVDTLPIDTIGTIPKG